MYPILSVSSLHSRTEHWEIYGSVENIGAAPKVQDGGEFSVISGQAECPGLPSPDHPRLGDTALPTLLLDLNWVEWKLPNLSLLIPCSADQFQLWRDRPKKIS